MFAMLRLAAMCLVVLTVVFVCVSLYSRAVRKDKLEAEWDETRDGDRDAFVQKGLDAYAGSFRRKLIFGVYVVPIVILVCVIYFTNAH